MEQIIDAGRVAPSAKNRQPWKYLVYSGEAKEDSKTQSTLEETNHEREQQKEQERKREEQLKEMKLTV